MRVFNMRTNFTRQIRLRSIPKSVTVDCNVTNRNVRTETWRHDRQRQRVSLRIETSRNKNNPPYITNESVTKKHTSSRRSTCTLNDKKIFSQDMFRDRIKIRLGLGADRRHYVITLLIVKYNLRPQLLIPISDTLISTFISNSRLKEYNTARLS